MSFGGHVNDMVNRIKQNAALKDARRRKFKGGNDYLKVSHHKAEYNFPKLSKEGIENFKNKVKAEAKLENIRQIKIWVFVATLISILMFLLFNYF